MSSNPNSTAGKRLNLKKRKLEQKIILSLISNFFFPFFCSGSEMKLAKKNKCLRSFLVYFSHIWTQFMSSIVVFSKTSNNVWQLGKSKFSNNFLGKLSKCEVKAWLCWNLITLLPLPYYVKSNFGGYKQFKYVNFGIFRGSEFWF